MREKTLADGVVAVMSPDIVCIEEFADVDLEAVELADTDPAAGGEVEGCRGVGADVGLMDAMVIGLIDAMVARMAWRRQFFDLDDGGGA